MPARHHRIQPEKNQATKAAPITAAATKRLSPGRIAIFSNRRYEGLEMSRLGIFGARDFPFVDVCMFPSRGEKPA